MTRSLQKAARALAAFAAFAALVALAVLAAVAMAWALLPDAAIADSQQPAPPQELTQLAAGSGRDLTVSRCIVCHSLEYIPSNAPAMNRTGWEKTIQKMRDRFGAPITTEEGRQILDYLAANYSGKP